MKLPFFIFALIVAAPVLAAAPARADQPEAGEIARNNNCQPSKIDVYQVIPGSMGSTIYQVTCNLPKTVDPNTPAGPNGLLIECDQSLCALLRPITLKK